MRSYSEAKVNAEHYAAATNRFRCEPCGPLAQDWYLRSHELIVVVGEKKGRFRASLSKVRMLFPDEVEVEEQITRIEEAVATVPQLDEENAKSIEDLEMMRKSAFDQIGPRVDQSVAQTIDSLVSTLETVMAQKGYGAL